MNNYVRHHDVSTRMDKSSTQPQPSLLYLDTVARTGYPPVTVCHSHLVTKGNILEKEIMRTGT